MIPPSVAIEIENGGDFATLVYSWKFQLEGPSTTDFAPEAIEAFFRRPFSDVLFLALVMCNQLLGTFPYFPSFPFRSEVVLINA